MSDDVAVRGPERHPLGVAGRALRAAAGHLLPPVILTATLAGAWQLMVWTFDTPFLPSLGLIWQDVRRITTDGHAFVEIALTLQRIVLGLLLAFAAAFALALPAARSRKVRAYVEPLLLVGLVVPGLVWALLCVIWFGFSLKTPVIAIALSVAPALVLTLIQGFLAIDGNLVEMARIFRFGRLREFFYLWLPGVAPTLVGAVRLGFSLAWKVVVLVEAFGMSSGVGYRLNSEFSSQNVAGVLAWTVVFGALMAVIEYGLLQVVERHVTRWRKAVAV